MHLGEKALWHATKELRGPPLGLETPFYGYNASVEVTDLLEHGGRHVCVSFVGVSKPSVNRRVDRDIPRSPELQPSIPM